MPNFCSYAFLQWTIYNTIRCINHINHRIDYYVKYYAPPHIPLTFKHRSHILHHSCQFLKTIYARSVGCLLADPLYTWCYILYLFATWRTPTANQYLHRLQMQSSSPPTTVYICRENCNEFIELLRQSNESLNPQHFEACNYIGIARIVSSNRIYCCYIIYYDY